MADKIPNPFEYSKDPELNVVFDKLLSLQARVAERFAKAEKIAGLANATGFVKLHNVETSLPQYRSLRTTNGDWRPKTPLDQIDAIVQKAVTEIREKIAGVEALNVPLIEQNKALTQQITEMMARIGVPASYTTYEYPTSRSKTQKSVPHLAGFIGDIQRATPVSNTHSKKYELDGYIREYERWVQSEKDTEQKEKLAKDEKVVQSRILGNPELVATLMQAGVNILTEVQNAVPGRKAEVIEYCIAKACKNVNDMPTPDEALIEKLENFL
jgi:hypothetical protein